MCHTVGIPYKKKLLTRFCAKMVLSPLGKCSSSASTTQLAMMVSSTAYSKGGHSMMNFVYLKIETILRFQIELSQVVIFFCIGRNKFLEILTFRAFFELLNVTGGLWIGISYTCIRINSDH